MEFRFNNDILSTARLKLRPLKIEDAHDMFEYTSHEDSSKYLSWTPHTKLEETVLFIENVVALYGNSDTEFSWAIELMESQKMIGVVKFFDINKNNNRAEISYILNSKFQGKGYINEAISVAIDFAFDKMKIIRIQARCTNDNIGSEKVMQRANMKFEGLLKKYWILKGETKDVLLYAFTK